MKTTFLAAAAVLLLGSAAMAQQKVDVCHVPPGNPSNAHIISVGASAIPAHLAHGDRLVSDEVCDGIDNDCDGTVDDGPTDVGQECTVGEGECEATGTVVCVDGARECDAQEGEPSDETCDGLDNDCDGVADEGGVCEPPPSLIGDLVRIEQNSTELGTIRDDEVIVVGGAAEIDCPNAAFELCGGFFRERFDVEAASLTFDSDDAGPSIYSMQPFAGFIFSSLDLVGGTGDITGFTLSTDITGLDESRVTFTADSVSVNLQGLFVDTGESFTVNLLSE